MEQTRIEWTRSAMFEDWWLHTQSILTNDALRDSDVAALLKTSYEQYRRMYDELLERERRNRHPLLGTDYETG